MATEIPNPLSPAAARPGGLLQQGRSQLEELVVLVSLAVQGMWRYRWPALLLSWGVCAVGWTAVYAMPDVYRASTLIYIDAESMIKRVVGDLTVSGDTMTEINVLTRAILSQPQLEKTAIQAGLDVDAASPEAFEQLIAELGVRIQLAKEGATNVFRISFEDSNHQRAETVVQTLLDIFREDAYGERRIDAGAAEQFVNQQIAEYERRLNEAEERLATFKRDNIGTMPGDRGDYYTRLQRSMEVLEDTRGQLRLATERRAEYQQQLQGEEPVFGIVAPAGGTATSGGSADAQIAQYETELHTMLLRFTDNHPDVIALRETIDRLKAQRAEAGARLPVSSSAGSPALETNPVYQRMRIGLSETEVEIATLRSQVAAQQTEVENLQKLVDTIPDTERQLTALNRDYDVTLDNYEALLKRRESLHITGEVEQSGDQLQFRVLEPPRASLAPVGPDRPLFLVVTCMLAVCAGVGLAFLLQQLNPVFDSRRELREVTGLPVLGAISLIRTAEDRMLSKKRTLVFCAVAAALPLALALAILVENPAHRAVERIFSALPL